MLDKITADRDIVRDSIAQRRAKGHVLSHSLGAMLLDTERPG
jgi:hypothetical protein